MAEIMPSTSFGMLNKPPASIFATKTDRQVFFSGPTGFVPMDDEGLFRLKVGHHRVWQILGTAHDLQVRLMVCPHERKEVIVIRRLLYSGFKECCCWSRMDTRKWQSY